MGKRRGRSEDGVGERCWISSGFWRRIRPLMLYLVKGSDMRCGDDWVRWAQCRRRAAHSGHGPRLLCYKRTRPLCREGFEGTEKPESQWRTAFDWGPWQFADFDNRKQGLTLITKIDASMMV